MTLALLIASAWGTVLPEPPVRAPVALVRGLNRIERNARRFDFERGDARIRAAQQKMNAAPTFKETAYWHRIWRARRRAYRLASKRQ